MISKIAEKSRTEVPDQKIPLPTPNRKFWTMRVEPGKPTILGDNLGPGMMVVQNHGPGTIHFQRGYGDPVKLRPGRVRIIATHNKIEVVSSDKKAALLEFEFTVMLIVK